MRETEKIYERGNSQKRFKQATNKGKDVNHGQKQKCKVKQDTILSIRLLKT